MKITAQARNECSEFRSAGDGEMPLLAISGAMADLSLFAALETASADIARLDARISASPLSEFWQLRASLEASLRLAEIDGTPTMISHLAGYIMGTPLPSSEAYVPAGRAFGHWARMSSSIEWSPIARQLLGISLSVTQKASEVQADWDAEDNWPRVPKSASGKGESWEDLARQAALHCLQGLRADCPPPRLLNLANELKYAMRRPLDPDYYIRIFEVKKNVERNLDKYSQLWTSDRLDEIKSIISWDARTSHSACFSVLPDALMVHGITKNRLSCLTGATKRFTFEGRLDDRARRGFLRALAAEAQSGLKLLDRLESLVAFGLQSQIVTGHARSTAADVLYAFFLLPGADALWLSESLGMQERVVRKTIKRFADFGIIEPWGKRRIHPVGADAREVQLWALRGMIDPPIVEESVFLLPEVGKAPSPPLPFDLGRLQRFEPMQDVYRRFDDELIEIGEAYSHLFDRNWVKKRAPQTPLRASK